MLCADNLLPGLIVESSVKQWELCSHFGSRWKIPKRVWLRIIPEFSFYLLATICKGRGTSGPVDLWHVSPSHGKGVELNITVRPGINSYAWIFFLFSKVRQENKITHVNHNFYIHSQTWPKATPNTNRNQKQWRI